MDLLKMNEIYFKQNKQNKLNKSGKKEKRLTKYRTPQPFTQNLNSFLNT